MWESQCYGRSKSARRTMWTIQGELSKYQFHSHERITLVKLSLGLHIHDYSRSAAANDTWEITKIGEEYANDRFGSYMLLAGEAGGGRREADHGAVAVLGGRQREEGVGDRLRQLRPLPQALLPQLLPARNPGKLGHGIKAARHNSSSGDGCGPGGGCGGEVMRRVVGHEVAEVHLVVGGGGGGRCCCCFRHGCAVARGGGLGGGFGEERDEGLFGARAYWFSRLGCGLVDGPCESTLTAHGENGGICTQNKFTLGPLSCCRVWTSSLNRNTMYSVSLDSQHQVKFWSICNIVTNF